MCCLLLFVYAEIVCHEQTVMTRVASDIQSSSRWNSGGRRLVLKPLDFLAFLSCGVVPSSFMNIHFFAKTSLELKCVSLRAPWGFAGNKAQI